MDAGRRHLAARWWWAASVLLLVAGGTLVTIGLRGHSVALSAPRSLGHPVVHATPYSVARSTPVRLVIPSIGVNTSLVSLGLTKSHTVQVPSSWNTAGWYRFGPAPGQIGSAVILGHVDSYLGPAVFYELRTLRPGDKVLVTLADGRRLRFAVTGVGMYPKSNFPTELVYGPRHYSALELVTCGGAFDEATRHYLSNVVVYTSLVGPHGTVARA